MGSIDTGGDSKSVDVHLNIVPFVDLMTCLTAFLLVTAVWTNLAQINIKPKGIGRDAEEQMDEEEPVKASILITEGSIWVGLTRVDDFREIKKDGDRFGPAEMKKLREILVEHKKSSYFVDREDIEIGAEDKVDYDTIIGVMDRCLASGFKDVGLADPASLSAKPTL
jgi:biopolymer transport protein ExbD